MARTVYALLVGIDDYPPPVPRLRGCVNDIREMRQYLEARVDPGARGAEEVLRIEQLLDGEATREAVIQALRTHLGQAGAEDVALFCYSGHGSQEPAPEEFWHLEPDRLDETLVLYDSRTPGSWDLADKELAKLIAEVSSRGAHVVVVLDCCHSGSGTRAPGLAETAVRRVETDTRQRPLDSFIVGVDELIATSTTRDLATRPSGWDIAGRHVLMAACRDDEEAREYQGGGATRGAFSYFLGETLRGLGGGITYRDLFTRTAALVRGQVQRQSPQLEATLTADLEQPFLGGAVRPSPRYFVLGHQAGRWSIDAGRFHGIPAPTQGDSAELAVFDYGASEADLRDPARAIRRAVVTQVSAASSLVRISEGELDAARAPFKAVLLHLPTPRLKVRLRGDPGGVQPARQALSASLFVREADSGEAADYRLLAEGGRYLIAKPDDDRPLAEQIDGYTSASARTAVERLEHIERWKTTAGLDNPAGSIAADELQVEVHQEGRPLRGPEIRLEYARSGADEWSPPEITIRLKNTGTRTLFVGLLDLPETFGIFSLIPHVGCQRLDPGDEVSASGGDPIRVSIPDDLWRRGVGELRDVVKVIVGTTEFDTRRLEQPDLDQPRVRAADTRGLGGEELGTLERLMERVQTRHMSQAPPRRIDDWGTLQFTFTTVRPLPSSRLEPGRAVALTDGVRVESHPALRAAAVRLSSLPQASRAAGGLAPLPRMLYDDPTAVQPFELAATRGIGSVLNVLELSGVNDPGLVTPSDPLTLVIPRPLEPGEHLLPVGFDGEFYLPLGRAEAAGGETRVVIERLPRPSEADSRSLGGSLRILFQKVVGRAFGVGYRYPVLAVAEVGDDLRARYEPDPGTVRAAVERAERIALFVHGIIGDTRGMAASLRRAGAADRYDLVLTFDYENLQDPITETARALKRRLAEAGLGAGHGKSLDVVAHSMGGLVTRWFIEREGGDRVVRRLVMLGTPNGGSPWPRVQDWATTALAVGLNELSRVVWPASVLAGLVSAVEAVDVTLDQMAPDSPFLRDLHSSPDPHVPYLMIAGNTGLVAAGADDEERRSKLRRLFRKLWPDRLKYDVADLFFGGSDNDLAVSLTSMRHLPAGREPACAVRPAACDHVSYFGNPEGLKALADALG